MVAIIGITLFIVCGITHVYTVYANECCASLPDSVGECRAVCHKLTLTIDPVEQISLLATVPSKCPEQLMEFWTCVEQKLPVLLELGTFSGRPCCNLTKTRTCRDACVKAQSMTDIEQHCSHSTEDRKLFDCIDRQRDGEKCCGKSITFNSLTCKVTCWNMYLTNTITSSDSKRQLRNHCTGQNKDVFQCVNKQTRTTRQSNSAEGLHCCTLRQNETCRKVCEETLQSEESQHDMIDRVIAACGMADYTDPLYQCFLKQGVNSYHEGIASIVDLPKLHCCEKATSRRCADLCVETHAQKWSRIKDFEKTCGILSSPVSLMEFSMHTCLKDVEEPCQLGCSGLQYCTSMNDRPIEHFRSCNADADMAAQQDMLLWQQGNIVLPGISIPVKDIRTCEPDMWKAIACAYQIKPCYRKSTTLEICREDCVYIMNKCVDKTRLDRHTDVTDLCKRLPVTSSGQCISVKQYTGDETRYQNVQTEVTNPCKNDPCREDEVCLIYRRKCRHSSSCPHYVCRKGCKMGQVSKVHVSYGTDVIVPIYKRAEITEDCTQQEVCTCGHSGKFSKMCERIDCQRTDSCVIDQTLKRTPHGTYYSHQCNDCLCFAGDSVCTRRQCSIDAQQQVFTGIANCDCPQTYRPVCASNGKSYPSSCIALCMGQTEFIEGACSQHSPCVNNPCQTGYQCVPMRQTCLGLSKQTSCVQYRCVYLLECNTHQHEPVCDTKGVEYTNHCILLSKGKHISYSGHCVTKECSESGQVCGHNGETYGSECAALASRVTVDYLGPCKTLSYSSAAIGAKSNSSMCDSVQCKPVSPAGCRGVVPPWSCCPICGAELRVLVSNSLAGISLEVKKGPVTVEGILSSLSEMISVAECDVFGYLGLNNELVVLVTTVVSQPTALQVSACVREAERLEYLIQSRAPSITYNLILTPLLYARLRTPEMIVISQSAAFYTQPYIVIVSLLFVFLSTMFSL